MKKVLSPRDQVWYLIVWILDLCLLPYLDTNTFHSDGLGKKKKKVVFQVPCQKKTGSVGRLFFFFFC